MKCKEPNVFVNIWTPQADIYRTLGICEFADDKESEFDVFLYYRLPFFYDPVATPLMTAISDAWIKLSTNPSEFNRAVSVMLNDRGYLEAVYRFLGMPNFSSRKED